MYGHGFNYIDSASEASRVSKICAGTLFEQEWWHNTLLNEVGLGGPTHPKPHTPNPTPITPNHPTLTTAPQTNMKAQKRPTKTAVVLGRVPNVLVRSMRISFQCSRAPAILVSGHLGEQGDIISSFWTQFS